MDSLRLAIDRILREVLVPSVATMSAFGGGSAFQIFSDSSNSENQSAAHRRQKRVEVTSKATAKQPASKRPALGEISNNTRVQPLRAVKQVRRGFFEKFENLLQIFLYLS